MQTGITELVKRNRVGAGGTVGPLNIVMAVVYWTETKPEHVAEFVGYWSAIARLSAFVRLPR